MDSYPHFQCQRRAEKWVPFQFEVCWQKLAENQRNSWDPPRPNLSHQVDPEPLQQYKQNKNGQACQWLGSINKRQIWLFCFKNVSHDSQPERWWWFIWNWKHRSRHKILPKHRNVWTPYSFFSQSQLTQFDGKSALLIQKLVIVINKRRHHWEHDFFGLLLVEKSQKLL